MKQRINNRR